LNDGPKIPVWLEKRWKKNWKEEYEDIIKMHQNLKPPIDISVKSNAKYWAKELDAKLLLNGVLRIYGEGRIDKLSGFQLGEWWIQDFSSQIPVRLLNVKSGENILDLCAAPGGKTVQLATHGAKVTSVDKSASRLEILKSNLKRLKLTSELINKDILKYKFNKNWSKILLDAPCSSTGILRRHPDIMHNKDEKEVLLLTSIQEKLLEKSWSILNQNGFLVYCTCSLEKEEGEDQIEKFLKKYKDARIDKILESEVGGIEKSISEKGWLRILPHHYNDEGGIDGFFIARLKKV
jgi:16S rRNA (cytosine967-C5)-methyltransferase